MLEKQIRSIKKALKEVTGEDVSIQLKGYFFQDRDKATALRIAGALIQKLGSGAVEEEEYDESSWVKVADATTSLIIYYDNGLEAAEVKPAGKE